MFSRRKAAKFSVAVSVWAPVKVYCDLSLPYFSPGNGIWRTAHCISHKHSVPSSLHVDVHIMVLSKVPLSATAYLCHGWNRSWSLLVRNLCSRIANFWAALSARLVWSSDVEKQECAENRSSLRWNVGHERAEFLPSSYPGKLYLGSGNFCFVIFSDGQLWAICHSGSTLVEKNLSKQ